MSDLKQAAEKALEALEEIALAGMSGTGQESEEGMRDWHARQAWKFIGIAARALEPVRAALASVEPSREPVADGLEPAPPNSLPDWDECAMRVANSDFIAKRVAEGGYGPDPDSKLATQLHRFIHEYDDSDPYRSAWFLHRLELLLNEVKALAAAPTPSQTGEQR